METIKRSRDISSLKKDTHQTIQIVNSEFSSLNSSVYESSELQMSETKQNHEEISKKLRDHKKEVESRIDNIHSEIVNLQTGNDCI
jgi:predicted  nucleic acid-binding Zn-ribbon protein